jgi:tetratricopeptide (TPR) repeat protein
MVIKLESSNYDAWYDYGCALLDAKLFDNALRAFDKVIKFHPFWAEPYYEKAKIHFLKEEIESGIDMLEKAFELNPEDRFEYDFMQDWKKILNFLIKR